jgi:hypothetical protein
VTLATKFATGGGDIMICVRIYEHAGIRYADCIDPDNFRVSKRCPVLLNQGVTINAPNAPPQWALLRTSRDLEAYPRVAVLYRSEKQPPVVLGAVSQKGFMFSPDEDAGQEHQGEEDGLTSTETFTRDAQVASPRARVTLREDGRVEEVSDTHVKNLTGNLEAIIEGRALFRVDGDFIIEGSNQEANDAPVLAASLERKLQLLYQSVNAITSYLNSLIGNLQAPQGGGTVTGAPYSGIALDPLRREEVASTKLKLPGLGTGDV